MNDRTKPRRRHDIAVIGAGPAGSAIAALLARQGRDVVLLEKEFFPREKLCGEFLSMESQGLLKRIGCLDAVLARNPSRITMSRFFSPSGRCSVLPLPGEALGISRAALDEILFRHAQRCGALALEGAEVLRLRVTAPQTEIELNKGSVLAGLAIGAYGRRSPLDRQLGRRNMGGKASFIGLKRHHRPLDDRRGDELREQLRGCVEIHSFDGGYGGISFVEDGQVNVCFLLRENFLRKLPSPRWDNVRQALAVLSPGLHRRLEALCPSEEAAHAVAQLRFDIRETHHGPALFIGDAVAMIAPLCGDGQAMALRSAALLAERISLFPNKQDYDSLARDWDRAWKAEFRSRIRLGRVLQRILLRPAACETAVLTLRLFPNLGRFLIKATRGRI